MEPTTKTPAYREVPMYYKILLVFIFGIVFGSLLTFAFNGLFNKKNLTDNTPLTIDVLQKEFLQSHTLSLQIPEEVPVQKTVNENWNTNDLNDIYKKIEIGKSTPENIQTLIDEVNQNEDRADKNPISTEATRKLFQHSPRKIKDVACVIYSDSDKKFGQTNLILFVNTENKVERAELEHKQVDSDQLRTIAFK